MKTNRINQIRFIKGCSMKIIVILLLLVTSIFISKSFSQVGEMNSEVTGEYVKEHAGGGGTCATCDYATTAGSAISATTAASAGTAEKADSALNLYQKVEAATRTIYISEWPVGNDTTGDGSITTPWHSINKALLDIGSIHNAATITILIDTGDYDFTPSDMSIMMHIDIFNGNLVLDGTRVQYSTSDLVVTDTAFRFHSNITLTPNELKGKWSGSVLSTALPIYENGTDYAILGGAYPLGSITGGIYENRTRLNTTPGWNVEFKSTKINSGLIMIRGVDLLTDNRLMEISQLSGNFILFAGCKLYVKFIRGSGMRVEKCHILTTLDGFRSTNNIINVWQCLIESTGSGVDGIELKGNRFIGDELVFAGFTNGITNTVGTTGGFDLTTGLSGLNTYDLMFSDCVNAFTINAGLSLNVTGANSIVLDNVDYLYDVQTMYDALAIFDTAFLKPYEPQIAWVSNDNGQRVAPQSNYILYIHGIHDNDSVIVPIKAYVDSLTDDCAGQLYISTPQTTTMTIDDQYYTLTGFTTDYSINCTLTDSTLIIGKEGLFSFGFDGEVTATTNNALIEFAVFINDASGEKITTGFVNNNAGDEIPVSIHGIGYANTGDVVKVKVQSDNNGSVTLVSGNIFLKN